MMLATREHYDYPHVDWLCIECGEVYRSSGYPPETRCTEGHGIGWGPEPRQIQAYIEVLESIDPGDGIVVCGHGPAPLMASVAGIDRDACRLVTESIDLPSRVIEWEWTPSDGDDYLGDGDIRWWKVGDDPVTCSEVFHVETVDVVTADTSSRPEAVDD